jgi:hypothetical protein
MPLSNEEAICTFGALWEVEGLLIARGYRDKLQHEIDLEVWRDAVWAASWHATPEQKIAALGSVLRLIVEARGPDGTRASDALDVKGGQR